jgi:hypothetical protein
VRQFRLDATLSSYNKLIFLSDVGMQQLAAACIIAKANALLKSRINYCINKLLYSIDKRIISWF